jgi:hypothetical protein
VPALSRSAWSLGAALVASALFGFGSYVTVPRPGLDPSYVYCVNRASVEGLAWGREIVSTYGPFGYVLSPLALDGIPSRWIGFQLALVLGVALAAWALVRSVGASKVGAIAAVVVLSYDVHVQELEQRWLGLLLLLIVLARDRPLRWAGPAFALAGALAGGFALIKTSLGLGGIATAIAGALVLGRRREAPLRAGCALAGSALGIATAWTIHYGTLSGLGSWFSVARSTAAGYASAMSLAPEESALVVGAFLLATLVLGVTVLFACERGALPALAAAAAPLAMTFRHAVTRLDRGHVRVFPLFALLIVILLVVAFGARRNRRVSGAIGLAVVLILLFAPWSYFHARHPQDSSEERTPLASLLEPLGLPGLGGLRLAFSPTAARAAWERETQAALEPARLPEAARRHLEHQSVDAYPWEISYVLASGLDWRPRPSPASFATYNPELDALNAAFFASPDRPRFLIWHTLRTSSRGIDSIDQRHLFWDEPATLLRILDGYDLVATHPAFLLLAARATPRFGERTELGTVRVRWQTDVEVPQTDGVVLAEIRLNRPWTAALRRALFREDPASIALAFDNGAKTIYRFVPDQAATGLWISPLPWREGDLATLLRGEPLPRVTTLRFDGAWASASAPPLEIHWWRLR